MLSRLTGDVTILYQGGSGGFFLYYLMLLSGNYNKDFDVWDLIYKQFPRELITSQAKWKHTEMWPNNVAMSSSSNLFLICNPLFCPTMLDHNVSIMKDTTIVMLYTDLALQLRLAYDKQAYWFTDVSKHHFAAPHNNVTYLRKIKSSFAYFNSCKVDPMILSIIEKFAPTHCVKLQDVLADTSKFNNEQCRFIEYWLTLHSEKTIQMLKTDNVSV